VSIAVTAVEAGRIRDAARLIRVGGVLAIICFFVSFAIEPAIFGFALWPIAFAYFVFSFLPILRSGGVPLALIVTAIGLAGAGAEAAGIALAPAGAHLRINPVFGVGTIAMGTWFVGASVLTRAVDVFPPTITTKLWQGGLGFGLIGASWFLDTGIDLFVLFAGALLSGRVDAMFKLVRRFGLPPEPGAAVAVEATAGEAIGAG
jgi:hypothetical protein